jgi:hypothetical protein
MIVNTFKMWIDTTVQRSGSDLKNTKTNFVMIGFLQIILHRKNRELMKDCFFCQQNYGVTFHDGQSIRKEMICACTNS